MDFEALLAANRYGGHSEKKPEVSLDVILSEHRFCDKSIADNDSVSDPA